MDHVAIMKKSWGLTEKILNGQKTIESRWYESRRAPLDRIKAGDTVYFKNSGELVCIKSKVEKIIQFEGLTPDKVRAILKKYGKEDGIAEEKLDEFYQIFKNKKYCILVFLKKPISVKPFDINKSGFGAMSAWLAILDISKIKK